MEIYDLILQNTTNKFRYRDKYKKVTRFGIQILWRQGPSPCSLLYKILLCHKLFYYK